MSNVLIGIIGVILFIGLALAGALILGDDFRSASSSSKAAAVTSQLQQGVQAVNMYQIKTGRKLDAGEYNSSGASFLVPRFLKTMPENPTGGGAFFAQAVGGSTTSGPMYILVAPMPRTPQGRAICEAVAEMAGTTPGNGHTTMQSGGVGCAYSSADPLYYVAYVNVF